MEQRGNSAGWRKQIGVIFSRREAKMVKASHSWGGRRFESCHGDYFYIPKYFISKSDFSMLPRREVRQLFDFHYQI